MTAPTSVSIKIPARTASVITCTYFIVAFVLLGAKIADLIAAPWLLATVMLWAPVALGLGVALLGTVVFGLVVLLIHVNDRHRAKIARKRLAARQALATSRREQRINSRFDRAHRVS